MQDAKLFPCSAAGALALLLRDDHFFLGRLAAEADLDRSQVAAFDENSGRIRDHVQ